MVRRRGDSKADARIDQVTCAKTAAQEPGHLPAGVAAVAAAPAPPTEIKRWAVSPRRSHRRILQRSGAAKTTFIPTWRTSTFDARPDLPKARESGVVGGKTGRLWNPISCRRKPRQSPPPIQRAFPLGRPPDGWAEWKFPRRNSTRWLAGETVRVTITTDFLRSPKLRGRCLGRTAKTGATARREPGALQIVQYCLSGQGHLSILREPQENI